MFFNEFIGEKGFVRTGFTVKIYFQLSVKICLGMYPLLSPIWASTKSSFEFPLGISSATSPAWAVKYAPYPGLQRLWPSWKFSLTLNLRRTGWDGGGKGPVPTWGGGIAAGGLWFPSWFIPCIKFSIFELNSLGLFMLINVSNVIESRKLEKCYEPNCITFHVFWYCYSTKFVIIDFFNSKCIWYAAYHIQHIIMNSIARIHGPIPLSRSYEISCCGPSFLVVMDHESLLNPASELFFDSNQDFYLCLLFEGHSQLWFSQ